MARKDVFKGTLEALINPPARPHSKSILQSAALGAVESGLARGLQLTELEPDQIIQSEFEDRLPYNDASLADLVESMSGIDLMDVIRVGEGAPAAVAAVRTATGTARKAAKDSIEP